MKPTDWGRMGNLYELLQVQPQADPEVIRAAYKAMMKLVHPDAGGDGKLAAKVNDAYAILSDEDSRKGYDRWLNGSGEIIGNYEIIDTIGEGGFGVTYKARHRMLGELVCIKRSHEITPEDRDILIEETKAIWDIRHHGLPAMRDMIKLDDGGLAIVMSYIPFPSLTTIIKKVGDLDPEHVAWITERSLGVLGYLHYHGIVHGDVKPDNLMVDPKSHSIVLVDFGLATRNPKKDTYNKGYTPYFAAPEQIQDLVPPSPATDFYSLGKTMLYAINGGDIAKVQSQMVPKSVPKPFRGLISRLTAYDARNRPSWEDENLVETIAKVRTDSFGRRRSGVLQIEGL